MLCVPLDFDSRRTNDGLVESGAYASAIAQIELDRIKQQAPINIFKFNKLPKFQIQVAEGQSERPLARNTPKLDIGDNTFAERFVVLKNLTGPFIGQLKSSHYHYAWSLTISTFDNASQKCCDRKKVQNRNLSSLTIP